MAADMAMWEYLTGIMGDTFYQSPSQIGCAIILSGHRGIQPVESDVATMQDICDEFSFPQALKPLKHHCVD